MSQPALRSRRSAHIADETRGLILRAAETEFAARGFAQARLEDMAERVGITRAAIIYHYGDKQALYDTVLSELIGDFARHIEAQRAAHEDPRDRVMAIVDSFIAYSWRRPTLARLFMREVADAGTGFRPFVAELLEPLFSGILSDVDRGRRENALGPVAPQHLLTILAGATTWHATSAPLLEALTGPQCSSEEAYAAYREQLLAVAAFLLEPRVTPEGAERSAS